MIEFTVRLFSLKDYGGSEGMTSDNTLALATGLNDVALKGGQIIVPAGTWRYCGKQTIDGGVDLNNRFSIRGEDRKASILYYDGADDAALTVIGAGSHARSLAMSNLTFKCAPTRIAKGISISSNWSYYTQFENVDFQDWRNDYALDLNKSYLLQMSNVYFRSCAKAFSLGGTQAGVDFVNAAYLDNVSVEFGTSTAEIARVEQSRAFHWCGGTIEANASGIHLKNVANYSIKDLYFEANGANTPWLEIERCGVGLIENNYMPATPGATMIRLQGRCTGAEKSTCTISNNAFNNYTVPPIVLGTPSTQAFVPLLLNNNFSGTGERVKFTLVQPPTETDYAPLFEITDNILRLRDNLGAVLYESSRGGLLGGTIGGLNPRVSEASATLSGASTIIQVNIPPNAKLLGCQLRVDAAITSADGTTAWAASYSGGNAQPITAAQPLAKNTKVSAHFNPYAANPITTSEVDITITPDFGTFSGGVVRAVVYYEVFTPMVNAL